MNQQGEDTIPDIIFRTNRVMEFLFAICDTAKYTKLSCDVGKGLLAVEAETMEMLSAIHRKASRFMHQELDSLFGDQALQLAFFAYGVERAETATIDDFIAKLELEEETVIFTYMIRVYFDSCVSSTPEVAIREGTAGTIESMLELIKSSDSRDPAVKDRLCDLVYNHKETRQRYIQLFRSFYDRLYREYEGKVILYVENALKKYERLYRENPRRFWEVYLNIQPGSFHSTAYIHVSCFHQGTILILHQGGIKDSTWIGVAGNTELNITHRENTCKEQMYKLFKLLSDRTRIEIISLLKERPWYSQELAAKLEIAPSTVNHHFAQMLDMGIITMERYEHRMYYSLKKQVFEELLKAAVERLLC